MYDYTQHLPPPSHLPMGQRNPFGSRAVEGYRSLPPVAKYAIVGTLGVAVIATGVAIYRAATRLRPIQVNNEACSDFSLGSQAELDEAIRPIIREHMRRRPAVDPFAVTTDFIHRYAPVCKSYPEESRNPGEAALFVESFLEVMRVMDLMKLLTENQRVYFTRMIDVWAKAHGIPGGVPLTIPPSQPARPAEEAPAGNPRWRGAT